MTDQNASTVELDVGGRRFKTRVKTLTDGSSFFAAQLSDRWRKDGPIFLDRDPVAFGHVLNLLRDPTYPFPRAVFGHELEFYGVNLSACDDQVRDDGAESPVKDRSHPEPWQKNAFMPGQLAQIVSTGYRNHCVKEGWVADRPAQLRGNDAEGRVSFRSPKRRVLTGKTCSKKRVEVPSPSPENVSCRWQKFELSLDDDRWVDGWSDLEIRIRYRARDGVALPYSRWEFFRRDLLSLLVRRIQICSHASAVRDAPDRDPWNPLGELFRNQAPHVAEIRTETLNALQLVEDAAQNPSATSFPDDGSRLPSLLDVAFAESNREIRVSLAPLFTVFFRAAGGDLDLWPRTLLTNATVRVKLARDDPSSPVVLETCRLTAQSHMYDVDERTRIRSTQTSNPPNVREPPNPRFFAYLNWLQQRALAPKGATNISREMSVDQVLHEMLIFVRLVAPLRNDALPCPRYVRLKRVRFWTNNLLTWDWTELELLEHMADNGWTVRVPIYRACWSGLEVDGARVDRLRVEVEFWEPLPDEAAMFFGLRRDNLFDQTAGEPLASVWSERLFTL